MARVLVASLFAALSISATWAQPGPGTDALTDVSEYVGRLRTQHASVLSLLADTEGYLAVGDRSEATTRMLRQRLCAEAEATLALIDDLRAARTRWGLLEEHALLADIQGALVELRTIHIGLAGDARVLSATDRKSVWDQLQRAIGSEVGKVVVERLEIEGLADLLAADSLNEATGILVSHLKVTVEQAVEDEMERLVGFRFHDAGSLQYALFRHARRLVSREVGKLLVRITSNELVIEYVTGVLIRWLGPKLREALREKGHLGARVERSVQTLEANRRALNELPETAFVHVADRAISRAIGAIEATKYLQGDIARAGDADLKKTMDEAKALLEATIKRTRHRFIMDEKEDEGFLKGCEQAARGILDLFGDMEPEEPGPTDRGLPAGDSMAGTWGAVFDVDSREAREELYVYEAGTFVVIIEERGTRGCGGWREGGALRIRLRNIPLECERTQRGHLLDVSGGSFRYEVRTRPTRVVATFRRLTAERRFRPVAAWYGLGAIRVQIDHCGEPMKAFYAASMRDKAERAEIMEATLEAVAYVQVSAQILAELAAGGDQRAEALLAALAPRIGELEASAAALQDLGSKAVDERAFQAFGEAAQAFWRKGATLDHICQTVQDARAGAIR